MPSTAPPFDSLLPLPGSTSPLVWAGGTRHGASVWIENTSRDRVEREVGNQLGSLDPAPAGLNSELLNDWRLGFGNYDEFKTQLAIGYQLLHEFTIQFQLARVRFSIALVPLSTSRFVVTDYQPVIRLEHQIDDAQQWKTTCLLYTSPSPRDQRGSRMPSSA